MEEISVHYILILFLFFAFVFLGQMSRGSQKALRKRKARTGNIAKHQLDKPSTTSYMGIALAIIVSIVAVLLALFYLPAIRSNH